MSLIYKTRDEMEHELTERDMDSCDTDYYYDAIRYGIIGYCKYDIKELEQYYNESFQYDGDEYKIKEEPRDWDGDKNE